jgi:hypothetical protein
MWQAEIPEPLQDRDDVQRRLEDLAVQLFRGHGGAGELAQLIGEEAERITKRSVEAARKRAA